MLGFSYKIVGEITKLQAFSICNIFNSFIFYNIEFGTGLALYIALNNFLEVQMNIKKTLALMGALLILGAGLILADYNPQQAARNTVQNRVKSEFQVGPFFIDEDGDGICDFARDHDNDGIPNHQDPDWARPKDGSGYKGSNSDSSSSNRWSNKNGFRGGNAWSNQSSRQNRTNFGSGICDLSGPKGQRSRRGRGKS
jgi:hypothetical protein